MQQLAKNSQKGQLFILSAPAGTGKTTLVKALTLEFPDIIASVSLTTRPPRKGELPGKDYIFISEEEFQQKIAAQDFLEYVKLYGVHYGTSKKWVNEQINKGKSVILVIDTQGALQLKKQIKPVLIFVHPPSLEILKNRLIKRGTETIDVINQRLKWAEEELKAAEFYDYQFTNDKLDQAYEVLKSIIIAESYRTKKIDFTSL